MEFTHKARALHCKEKFRIPVVNIKNIFILAWKFVLFLPNTINLFNKLAHFDCIGTAIRNTSHVLPNIKRLFGINVN